MNDAAPFYEHYDYAGRPERLTRIGVEGPIVLILAPLFEEANKTRRLLIEAMRALAAQGHACVLPDLPGTLESRARLSDLAWSDWREAVAAVSAQIGPAHLVSIRGGALLDDAAEARSRWRLAPVEGTALLRDLVRVQMASLREEGMTASAAEVERRAFGEPTIIAGYRFGPEFLTGLSGAAVSGSARVVRLESDAQPADVKLAGAPPWRRAEPGEDHALSQALAADIGQWIATCAAG